MKPEEMDKAIAEHVGTADRWLIVKRGYYYRPNGCGYTSHEHEAWILPLVEAKKHEYLIGEEPVTISRAPIPAYSTDLNAMHEAEMFLVNSDDGKDAGCARYLYSRALYGVVVPVSQQPVMATARQRAEAFLRTIGKWRDE